MPRLQQLNDTPETNTQSLSIQGVAQQTASGAAIGKVQQYQGAQAIASAAQIGQQEQSFGSWMSQAGSEYFSRSMKSLQETIYNVVQSNAVKDYNDKASSYVKNMATPSHSGSSRYAKAVKLSQPGSTEKDLDTIAKNVRSTYSQATSNPFIKDRLNKSITELNTNHKTLAGTVERGAALDIGRGALQDALSTDIQSGLIDSPDNLGYYAATGIERIQKAVENGTIGVDDAAKLGDNLRSGLFMGALQVQNQRDPSSVGQLLATRSATDLNLTDIEYTQLRKQNDLAMKDVQTMAKYQYQAQNEISNAQSAMMYGALEEGVKSGQTTTSQIQEAYDKGKITSDQYMKLAVTSTKADSFITDTWRTRQNISADIASGSGLFNYSAKQIDDHYQNTIRQLSPDGSLNVDPATKINLAKQYKGPIDSLAKEIQYTLSSGDTEKIKDAVYMFNKIQTSNPLAFSGIKDKKFMAYASALSNAYKYTPDLSQANIQKVHDSIYNVDGRTMRTRENDFSQSDEFNSSIRTTIADMYDEGNPWYRGADGVSDETVDMLRPLLRDAYRQTGNADTAREIVANQTKAFFGHSAVNNTPKWGIDAGTVMALPPEKVYEGKATAEEIRTAFNSEITPLLPKGVTADQVMIGSDDLSMDIYRRTGNPQYYMYYKDKDGLDVLLPGRWTFDASSKQHLEAARANEIQKKVTPGSRVGTEVDSTTQHIVKAPNQFQQDLKQVLSGTKGFGESPVLNEEFIDKVGKTAYLPQLVSHYKGDAQQRPVVLSALTKMIGQDKDSWRVAQSLKLVNSVLANNSNPGTYLRFGKSTTTPSSGDIVVTKQGAGLFAGVKNVNNKTLVKIVALNGDKELSVSYIPEAEVRGYRSLPTPENFAKQDQPLSINRNVSRFNPYTGGPARAGTGQERFNPYTMETSIEPEDSEQRRTIINPATGEMVPLDQSFAEQAQKIKSASKEEVDSTRQYSSYAEDVGNTTQVHENRAPAPKKRSSKRKGK